MPAPSLSSQPHTQFLSLFLTLSQSLTCFFPAPLPFPSVALHALCIPFDKRPSQGRSRAISVHLICLALSTQPLSEQRAHVCGRAGCLLGFVCSRFIVYLRTWANGINGRKNWSNQSLCMSYQACLSAVVGTMNNDPSLEPSTCLCHISCPSGSFFPLIGLFTAA